MYMGYEKFKENIVAETGKYFNASTSIRLEKTVRLNHPEEDAVLILEPGSNSSPVIYLDGYYDDYRSGKSIGNIEKEIVTFYKENASDSGPVPLDFYLDFSQAREHIRCRLVNYEWNKAALEGIPHKRFFDLAIVYYYKMENPGPGKSGIVVRNSHLDVWGISAEQLHEIALRNTREQTEIQIMTVGLKPGEDGESEETAELGTGGSPQSGTEAEKEDEPGKLEFDYKLLSEFEPCGRVMYVITNEELYYGAVSIIFDDVLREISSRFRDNYYILPSSVHECILVPEGVLPNTSAQNFKEIVTCMNSRYVAPEELLADSVYRYDLQKQRLQRAA